jgi:hypothetical protein
MDQNALRHPLIMLEVTHKKDRFDTETSKVTKTFNINHMTFSYVLNTIPTARLNVDTNVTPKECLTHNNLRLVRVQREITGHWVVSSNVLRRKRPTKT